MVVVDCEFVGVGLVDFGVMVLELDSSFGGVFCLELGDMKKWKPGRVVSMVDVTGGGSFWGGGGGGEVIGVAPRDQARQAAHHISVHLFWSVNLCLPNFC